MHAGGSDLAVHLAAAVELPTLRCIPTDQDRTVVMLLLFLLNPKTPRTDSSGSSDGQHWFIGWSALVLSSPRIDSSGTA
eukprot:1193802-Prorocentrum_minimum.AAC.1